MNQYQKQVQKKLLENEGAVREKLKENYRAALKDVQLKIKKMMEAPGFEGEKAFQAKYQKMLSVQLETLLAKLGDSNAKDMTVYLNSMYHDAYLGCLYGMHKDGVDLILKVDENKVENAVNRDTVGMKFSKRLYSDVEELKKSAVKEIARGFSSGRDYLSIAKQISLRSGISERRAYRIARTEGHRIENEAKEQCMTDAKGKGAEVVKQWDSTLDDKTRTTHRELDGQVRELEEPFEIPSTGARAMYPGGFGIAGEDVNCRCCMLQRARWALESEAYKYSRFSGDIVSVQGEEYENWKSNYKKVVKRKQAETIITEKDIKAIYDYMSFSSYALNEALRNGWKLTEEQKALMNNLDEALKKMPVYKGNLQRSVDISDSEELQKFLEMMKPGTVNSFSQYISCTYGECYNPDARIQIYFEDTVSGKDISQYNQQEKEVIFEKNMAFEVESVKMIEDTYYILLREAINE